MPRLRLLHLLLHLLQLLLQLLQLLQQQQLHLPLSMTANTACCSWQTCLATLSSPSVAPTSFSTM